MLEEARHLVLSPGRLNHYGNQSCDPNLWWIDAVTLASRRDIDRGEELTHDYGTSTDPPIFEWNVGMSHDCVAGSSPVTTGGFPKSKRAMPTTGCPVSHSLIRAQPPRQTLKPSPELEPPPPEGRFGRSVPNPVPGQLTNSRLMAGRCHNDLEPADD